MTTQTVVVGTPLLPRVNLLPPEIAEARKLQTYRVGAGAAVLVACAAVGGLYWHAHGGVAAAQTALNSSQAQTAALNTQLTGLNRVTVLKGQVQSYKTTLASALAPEILWSHYMQDMSVDLAGNYWFTTLSMSVNATSSPTSAASQTPLSDALAVGNISFQGRAVTDGDVAKLLDALSASSGLSHPVLTSSTEDLTPLFGDHRLDTFNGTVSVDSTDRPATDAPAATPTSTAPVVPAAGTTAAAGATPTTTAPAGATPAGSTPTSATVSGATPTPAGH